MRFFKPIVSGLIAVTLSACGGGDGGNNTALTANSVSATPPLAPAPASVSSVNISGHLTYDRVPHKENSSLDYASTVSSPIRGAVIEAVNASGRILASTVSKSDGSYELALDSGLETRLQVKAHLLSAETAKWNFQVTDNTQQNTVYALQGSLASTGTNTAQIRDLHAPHGWTGQSYGNERAAAPFAILDTVYSAVQAFAAIDPNIEFPPLELHWSENNTTAIGDRSLGQIGTSFYLPNEDSGAIFILGQENADTDEYDQHVIIHEWGHYFEHQMSRTDSIGGPHSLNDRLDARVAFSEGWGNALSAIITGDPVYRDSSGRQQASGFSYNLESTNISNPGWFNEGSIGAIIYDIYDTQTDDFDNISAGLSPLYNVMRSETYIQSPVFSTIFAFADGLRSQGDISQDDFNTLLEGHAISGFGPQGNGESNNGAIQSALPLYKEVISNEGTIQFCSRDDAGIFNKLGNRDFIFLNLPARNEVTISAEKINGRDNRDPNFNIWQAGQLLHQSTGSDIDKEVFVGNLEAGLYVIEVFDAFNIRGNSSQRGDSCYELSVEG